MGRLHLHTFNGLLIESCAFGIPKMELRYAISLDRLRQTIKLQNATDLHVAARVVIFGFLLHTYDNVCQDSNIFKRKSIRFTIYTRHTLSHLIIYYPVDFPAKNPEEFRMIAAVTEYSGVPRNRSSRNIGCVR